VPYAFLIISGVLLALDLTGTMLMFEKIDDQLILNEDQSAYLIQNNDDVNSEIEISTEKYPHLIKLK